MDNSATLDHIVILVPHSVLLQLSDRLKGSFIIAPGGNHDNGITTNQLILLEDGVYLEFIAFFDTVSPDARQTHPWGRLKDGSIVDFAYTLLRDRDFSPVQKRLKEATVGIVYNDPSKGGRTKPDGTVIKWATAHPVYENSEPVHPGALPFWCLDETPRELRVPYEDGKLTKHPLGVRGVSQISIAVPDEEISALSKAYDSVHQAESHDSRRLWEFGNPAGRKHRAQHVSLSEASTILVELTLAGSTDSPATIEIMPGLVFRIDGAI